MNYREKIEDRLKMYKQKVAGERRPELVMFFAEHEGDPVDHVLLFEEQIPALMTLFDYEPPHMAIFRELGETKYVWAPKEARPWQNSNANI